MIPRLVVAVVAATAPVLALGPATAAKRGAAAATPFTITAAKKVSGATVAVDSGNTGHFAWIEHPASGSDLLRYCRIPRGGTACQAQKSWPLGNTSTVPQQVLTVGKKVVIAASSCCFNDTPTGAHLLAVVSEDGGSTFAEPVLVGTLMPGGRAVVGPGTSQISVATGLDSSGVRFQAAPLDRKTEAFANLGEGFGPGRWYNGSIGYVAATVPLVAVSDLNRVYWREWSGAGDYNSAGTWGKTTLLGKGDEPLLAGGSRGVFLLYALDVPNKDQYVVRRFDAAAHTFGAGPA